MRRIRRMLLLASLTAATVTGIRADPASADTAARINPPTEEIGTIPLGPGVDLLLPASDASVLGDGVNVTSRGCPYYHLCIWRDVNFGGYGIGFYNCGPFYLPDWGFAPTVNTGVSSVQNNQTPNTWSYFYDANWNFLYNTIAPGNTPWVGIGANDQATWVDVC